jgi:hypothetical protein
LLNHGEVHVVAKNTDKHSPEREFLDELMQRREAVFRARGNSMRPFVSDGDVLLLRAVDFGDCKAGDLLLLADNERMLLHRMLCQTDDGLVTKGDALEKPDSKWQRDDLIARVEARLDKSVWRDMRNAKWRVIGWAMAKIAPVAGPLLAILRASKRAILRP